MDPRCQGTNKLIKEGTHIVESVEDIVANLPSFVNIININKNIAQDSAENNPFKALDIKYMDLVTNNIRSRIKELLSVIPISFDCLHNEMQLPLPIIYDNTRIRASRKSCKIFR